MKATRKENEQERIMHNWSFCAEKRECEKMSEPVSKTDRENARKQIDWMANDEPYKYSVCHVCVCACVNLKRFWIEFVLQSVSHTVSQSIYLKLANAQIFASSECLFKLHIESLELHQGNAPQWLLCHELFSALTTSIQSKYKHTTYTHKYLLVVLAQRCGHCFSFTRLGTTSREKNDGEIIW